MVGWIGGGREDFVAASGGGELGGACLLMKCLISEPPLGLWNY